jgi:hypothetical protein
MCFLEEVLLSSLVTAVAVAAENVVERQGPRCRYHQALRLLGLSSTSGNWLEARLDARQVGSFSLQRSNNNRFPEGLSGILGC